MEGTGTKKTVFICVPMEKSNEKMLERQIAVAIEDYCKVRNCKPEDVVFVDFLHNLKSTLSKEEIDFVENKAKYPMIRWTADSISLLGECDEAILAINWTRSRICKVIATACENYFIPHIRMMKGEKNPNIEDNQKTIEYRKKHSIDVIWK